MSPVIRLLSLSLWCPPSRAQTSAAGRCSRGRGFAWSVGTSAGHCHCKPPMDHQWTAMDHQGAAPKSHGPPPRWGRKLRCTQGISPGSISRIRGVNSRGIRLSLCQGAVAVLRLSEPKTATSPPSKTQKSPTRQKSEHVRATECRMSALTYIAIMIIHLCQHFRATEKPAKRQGPSHSKSPSTTPPPSSATLMLPFLG